MDSDYHSIEVEIKGVAVERMKECRKKQLRGVWDEVERKRFKRKMGNVRGEGNWRGRRMGEDRGKDEEGDEGNGAEVGEVGKKKDGGKDEECRKKKEVRRELRIWRRSGEGEGVHRKEGKVQGNM